VRRGGGSTRLDSSHGVLLAKDAYVPKTLTCFVLNTAFMRISHSYTDEGITQCRCKGNSAESTPCFAGVAHTNAEVVGQERIRLARLGTYKGYCSSVHARNI